MIFFCLTSLECRRGSLVSPEQTRRLAFGPILVCFTATTFAFLESLWVELKLWVWCFYINCGMVNGNDMLGVLRVVLNFNVFFRYDT